MNQFSLQITELQHALLIETALSPLIGNWQINNIPGEKFFRFVFKSKFDLESVKRKLDPLPEIDLTFLDEED